MLCPCKLPRFAETSRRCFERIFDVFFLFLFWFFWMVSPEWILGRFNLSLVAFGLSEKKIDSLALGDEESKMELTG